MGSDDEWLEMSQNTTVETGYAGEYRREACNDAGLEDLSQNTTLSHFATAEKGSLVQEFIAL